MRGLSRTPNVDGLLVTMPHKNAAFTYCATSSQRAKLLGVVGAIRRNRDGTWHGEMFDGMAFLKAQINRGAAPKEARVLLVGAGGAGSAIAIALIESGVRELRVFDTDRTRCAKLVELLAGTGPGRALVAETADPTGCDMVCNATPLGMNPTDPIPVEAHLLKSSMFVGDVVAGHGVTPLLAAAQAAGCRTASGVDMVEAGRALMLEFFLEA
jgi:shikimate dehydrogenase